MKRVAIVGIQGLPANYGGFETFVENIIGDNCSKDIEYTVFCSSLDIHEHLISYKGAILKYVPLHANGIQSILYDTVSLLRVVKGYDAILILGISGCMFLPIFRLFNKKRLVINIDGLEYKRDKWGKYAKWFLKKSEAKAVKYADIVVADNKGIQNYVYEEYGKKAEYIAYGGNHVIRLVPDDKTLDILTRYGLSAGKYSLAICRIEPENNCKIILDAYSTLQEKLVFVGNWNHSEYSRNLKSEFSNYKNILLLDSIYDLDILSVLRKNSDKYIHGHGAGGTNPSLVEAMFFNRPILCFDVLYNKETTKSKAYYWKDADQLRSLILRDDLVGDPLKEIAEKFYTWKYIAQQYESLY